MKSEKGLVDFIQGNVVTYDPNVNWEERVKAFMDKLNELPRVQQRQWVLFDKVLESIHDNFPQYLEALLRSKDFVLTNDRGSELIKQYKKEFNIPEQP